MPRTTAALATLAALLIACTDADEPDGASPSAPTTSSPIDTPAPIPVAPGFTRVEGLEFDLPPHDLAALDPVVAQARLIGLGESVHFAGGYHQIRARALRYLIEEHGVRFVAVEAHWHTVETLTAPYVDTCEGSLTDALYGLYFAAWQSTSSAELLGLMCSWNQAHPDDPVRIVGVDAQSAYEDGLYLEPLFSETDPVHTASFREDLRACWGYGAPVWDYDTMLATQPTDDDVARCGVGVDAGLAWLDTQADVLDDDERVLTRVALRSALAATVQIADQTDWDPRDEAMAENLLDLWTLRRPDAKGVYWAHNAHIVDRGEDLTRTTFPVGWKPAGSHLGDALGDGYAPIAIVSRDVTYNWPGWGDVTSTARRTALEHDIAEAFPDEDLLFMDVAAAVADGTLVDDGPIEHGHPGTATGSLLDHYRGVLWLRESGPMTYAR